MQEQSYFNNKAVSQSSIKAWKYLSPKKWKAKFIDKIEDDDDENSSFDLGNLLDTMLFTPHLLKERFYISKLDKLPSDTERKITECIYTEICRINRERSEINKQSPEEIPYLSMTFEDNKEIVLSCVKNEKWNERWGDDAKYNTIYKNGNDYFKLLVESKNRKIISRNLLDQANELILILKNHDRTKNYFTPSEGIELLFQLELFTSIFLVLEDNTEFNLPLKGALDILVINHNEKSIQIVDFKKAGNAHQFLENVRKYGYCDQLSFYYFLLKETFLKENKKYENYEIKLPINICIDIQDKVPYIYEYNKTDLFISKYGNQSFLNNDPFVKVRKGWLSSLQKIAWHYKNDFFEEPYELHKYNKIKLDLIHD